MTTKSILAASVAAVDEAVRAEAALSRPATPVSEAEVTALVATLPDRAREGKDGNAGATVFVFSEWSPRDHHAAEVAGAALERLRALGLSPVVTTVRLGTRDVPAGILVDYSDLAAAAQREETLRVAWVESARAEWAKVGGEGADVRLVTGRSGGPVARFSTRALAVPVNDAAPFRLDFLLRAREREYEVEAFWVRPVAEVVAEAEEAIRPVAWTIPELEAAWRDVGSGAVSFSYGLFDGGQLRQCAVVEFRRGDQALKFAIGDVRQLSAADLAARALAGAWEAGSSAGPPARPDRAPAAAVAGNARDAALGITQRGDHRDAFQYIAPPGPPRVYPGDEVPEASALPVLTVPIAGGEGLDPTRMTPVQALEALPAMRAASRKVAAKPAPVGRARKSTAKAATS